MTSTGQSHVFINNFTANKSFGHLVRISTSLRHNHFRQRFQSSFDRFIPFRLTFLLIGQIQILQFLNIKTGLNFLFQLIIEFSLFLNRIQNRFLTRQKIIILFRQVSDITNFDLIQSTGHFFTIPRYKRNSCFFTEQLQGIYKRFILNGKLVFYVFELGHFLFEI